MDEAIDWARAHDKATAEAEIARLVERVERDTYPTTPAPAARPDLPPEAWHSHPPRMIPPRMTMTTHDPSAKVDPRTAADYRFEPRHERLAELQEADPDLFALLPAQVRQQVGPYILARQAARGAGHPVGPPANDGEGAATMNAAIRRKAGRQPQDSGLDAPAPPDPEVAANAILGAARAAKFRDPQDAVRLLADQVDDDGANAAELVAGLARTKPYYVAQPSWGSADGGVRGAPVPAGDNAAMNQWMRGRRDDARVQRGLDADSMDERIRRPGGRP